MGNFNELYGESLFFNDFNQVFDIKGGTPHGMVGTGDFDDTKLSDDHSSLNTDLKDCEIDTDNTSCDWTVSTKDCTNMPAMGTNDPIFNNNPTVFIDKQKFNSLRDKLKLPPGAYKSIPYSDITITE